MKVSLDTQFLDLKGYPLPQKMDDILANALALATVGPPAKMMKWAVDLTNSGEIDVDKEDANFLLRYVEGHPRLPNLFKSQLMERIGKIIAG